MLADIARKLELPVLDLYPVMKRLEAEGNSGHFPVDVHYNAAGADAAAEALSKMIKDRQLIPDLH